MAGCSSTAQAPTSPTPATTGSNSALTGLTSVTDFFLLQNGATVAPTGALSMTGSATVELDGPYAGGSGGTSLTIGGKLTNSSTNGYGLYIGNSSITSADTVTVNGAGGLSNTGYITIIGSASVRATLDIADAAAGFGTKGVETGTVVLENDALLEFKSGEITTINGGLQLDGARARVADAGYDWQQQRADGPYQRYRLFPSAERRNGRADRRFEHDRRRRVELDGPYDRRLRGHQPDDRREADQQQHQRLRPLHRQHRHHVGRHADGEWGRRALQRRGSYITIIGSSTQSPGDPEYRQCGGGVRHEGGGDWDGRP